MDINEVLKKVNEIFIDVLDNDDILLNLDTTANDVEDWDSLTHIQLVVAIEKYFKLRFNASQIREWKNVGELCESILARI